MSKPKRRIAIVGGGLAGVTAAWQLHQLGAQDVSLFEASSRFGGTVETVRQDGFVIECGPDGWVTEKPWATELAIDLGLAEELIHSNDATRVTYILQHGVLEPMPDGMRMMVPTDLRTLEASPLFTAQARQDYAAEPARAAELKASVPDQDESVAAFVLRHFGAEVLDKLAAPLLSGVFGGDVTTLSVRSVMPAFVHLEQEYGSLIVALQAAAARRHGTPPRPIFTSLKHGTQTLIDRMLTAIPASWLRANTRVTSMQPQPDGTWQVHGETFDDLLLCVPAHIAAPLLAGFSVPAGQLLQMQESSAIIVAFAFAEDLTLPQGFGFLVPGAEDNPLLASTFVDQKYPHRAPTGQHLLRAFFGGQAEPANDLRTDAELTGLALRGLEQILGHLPPPSFAVVRRWPRSLPQYAVGHAPQLLSRSTTAEPAIPIPAGQRQRWGWALPSQPMADDAIPSNAVPPAGSTEAAPAGQIVVITRESLQDNSLFDRLRARAPADMRVMTEIELEASLDGSLAALPPGQDAWLFGYGSLMWNPAILYAGEGAGAGAWLAPALLPADPHGPRHAGSARPDAGARSRRQLQRCRLPHPRRPGPCRAAAGVAARDVRRLLHRALGHRRDGRRTGARRHLRRQPRLPPLCRRLDRGRDRRAHRPRHRRARQLRLLPHRHHRKPARHGRARSQHGAPAPVGGDAEGAGRLTLEYLPC